MNKVMWFVGCCAVLGFALVAQVYAAVEKSASEWVAQAEDVHALANNYSVEVITEEVSENSRMEGSEPKGMTTRNHRASLRYSPARGLRGRKAGGSSFVVDIASMFPSTKELRWSIEKTDETVAGKLCVVVAGTFEGTLVMRLSIEKDDGTVVRYDQYLKGKHIGSMQ